MMIYKSIDKRYPYMAMLCELIDKYFVETLLCSGGGKMGIGDIHRRERFIMRWKVVTAMLLLALNNITYAQIADVSGVGEDRDSALRDAKRNAVEQVVGTYINSETLVSQASVVSDEIYAKSVGFITDVRVIDEGKRNGSYYVHAKIDVNTNQNSELMNRIEMIKALGDPRIGVVVFKNATVSEYGSAEKSYDDITEESVNSKLLSMGFSHVMDANIVAKLRNSSLLSSLYNGDTNLLGETGSIGVDVLVLAQSKVDAAKINLTQQDGTTVDTQLVRGTADITGKVIMLATGNIQGTFSVRGQGIDISENTANNKALKNASANAAAEVGKILRKKAAKTFDGLQIIASVNDNEKLAELVADLKNLKGVQGVYMREYQNGKAVIDIESNQQLHILLRMLKEKSHLGLFNEGITNNTMQLLVS